MITLAEAQSKLIEAGQCQLHSEQRDVSDALGRVARHDVLSEIAIPPDANSAMDGFAVRALDLESSMTLPISQRVPAGQSPRALANGSAARIFTGGVMPSGADAVVIQENCQFDAQQVTLIAGALGLGDVKPGDNVRLEGQDIQPGAMVVHAGQRLNAIDLGLLASIGRQQVSVYRPLRVAIFSTGDELVEPGAILLPGQIYNSNRQLLMALCQQLGFVAVDCGIVDDTLEATKRALVDAAGKADLILSSGGVSVGEEDHVKPAVAALGELAMWKVRMKPGKPVAFGHIAGTPFLGLPGNPVSSFTVFQLLGVPLMRALQGQRQPTVHHFAVQAGFDKALTSREEYIRVKLERDAHGSLVAQRFSNLSSGVMSSLSWADGLVIQANDEAIKHGQSVAFLPLKEGML